MDPARPEFVPDPALAREEMEAMQADIAAAATFENDFTFDSATITTTDTIQGSLTDESPIVVGIDQAFLDDRAVGAVVASQAGTVIERASAVVPCEFPYVPGLLSFREAGAIVAALANLSVEPDLAVFDGSGRIHYRQAGLATHLGVVFDVPSVGVAKGLLCGTPQGSLEGRAAGTRVPIEADDDVTAPAGTLLGYALQTRQYENSRAINPVYVSAGHRVGADTAADLVERTCAGYKLPEPTRRADAYAADVKAEYAE